MQIHFLFIMLFVLQNTKTLRVPKIIKYDMINHIYDMNDYTIKYFGVDDSIYKDVMDIKTILDFKKHVDVNSSNNSHIHLDLINKYFENNPENKIYQEEIFNNTFYKDNFEYWNITNLCKKYNITGFEVFNKMIDRLELSEEEAMEDFEHNLKYNNGYFDYYKNVGLKNRFPLNLDEEFKLNMRRYNDREKYQGYNLLLDLFVDKIKNSKNVTEQENIYKIIYQEKNSKGIDSKGIDSKGIDSERIDSKMIKLDEKLVEKINSMIPLEGKMEDLNRHYNWRCRVLYEKEKYKIDEYMMENYYNNSIKDNIDMMDLSNYFEFNNNIFEPKYIFFEKLRNTSIVNLLLFSKTRVNMESIPFLLELVRIKKVESYNDDIMILDNYKVSHKLTSSPKYSDVGFIEYDELDKDYKFAKSTYDKYLVVKFLKNHLL